MSCAVCLRFTTALAVVLFCWRSHSRCFLNDSVSSVANMLRRVVRGERAGGCVFEVVTMIGLDRGIPGACIISSSSGEDATDCPSGDDPSNLRIAGVDLDAMVASAVARSF